MTTRTTYEGVRRNVEALFEKGEYKNCITHVTRLISTDTRHSHLKGSGNRLYLSYFRRGMCFKHLKMYQEALEDFGKAVQHVSNSEAYFQRGIVNKELKKYQDAFSDFQESIRLNKEPNPQRSLFSKLNLGVLHIDMGRHTEAITQLTSVILLSPTYGCAYYYRGVARKNCGQIKEAIADFISAYTHDKEYVAALYQRALCYELQGVLDKAIADLEEYAKVVKAKNITLPSGSEGDVCFRKGRCFFLLKRFEESLKEFSYAKLKGFSSSVMQYYAAKILQEKNDTQQAMKELSEGIKMNPSCFLCYGLRGLLLVGAEKKGGFSDLENAISLMERSKYVPKRNEDIEEVSKIYFHRGNELYKKKQFRNAIFDYTKATELNPNFHHAYNNRGNCFVMLNLFDKALLDYTTAVTKSPKYHEGFNNRGDVLRRMGRSQEALNEYKHAVSINPKYEQARRNQIETLESIVLNTTKFETKYNKERSRSLKKSKRIREKDAKIKTLQMENSELKEQVVEIQSKLKNVLDMPIFLSVQKMKVKKSKGGSNVVKAPPSVSGGIDDPLVEPGSRKRKRTSNTAASNTSSPKLPPPPALNSGEPKKKKRKVSSEKKK